MSAPPAATVGAYDPRRHSLIAVATVLVFCHVLWNVPFRMLEHARCPHSAALSLRLNPNTATPAELELLPRIGPALAERIVAYREAHGPPPVFHRAEDLDAVARVGPKTVEQLRPFLVFDAPPPVGQQSLEE
jgi:competence ComEA-like helix-hairpin-helix protein